MMPAPARSADRLTRARALVVFVQLALGNAASGQRALMQALQQLEDATPPLLPWRALLDALGEAPPAPPALPLSLHFLAPLSAPQRRLALLEALCSDNPLELAALLRQEPARLRQHLAQVAALCGDLASRRDALATQLRLLPDARVHALLAAANAPAFSAKRATKPGNDTATRPRWHGRWLLLASAALLAAAGYLLWQPGQKDEADVRERDLLAGGDAASYFTPEAGLAGHPDRVLWEIAEADTAIAQETAFFAWYQATRLGVSSYEPPSPGAGDFAENVPEASDEP